MWTEKSTNLPWQTQTSSSFSSSSFVLETSQGKNDYEDEGRGRGRNSPRVLQEQILSLFTRRQMLHRMCAGFGMLGLASLLGPPSAFAASALPAPHFRPRAKRVIFLFMNGGPSHVDTFDPKPALTRHDGKPLPERFQTGRNRRNTTA